MNYEHAPRPLTELDSLVENALVVIGEQLATFPDLLPNYISIDPNRYVLCRKFLHEGWRVGTFLQAVNAVDKLTKSVTAETVNYLRAAIWEAPQRKPPIPTRELCISLTLATMTIGQKPITQLRELTDEYTEATCDMLESVLKSAPQSDVDPSAAAFSTSIVRNAVGKIRNYLRKTTEANAGYVLNAVNSGNIAQEADRLLQMRRQTPHHKMEVSPFKWLDVETFYQQTLKETIQRAYEQYRRRDYIVARTTAAHALSLQPDDEQIQKDLQKLIILSTPSTTELHMKKLTLMHALEQEKENEIQGAYETLTASPEQWEETDVFLQKVRTMILGRVQPALAKQRISESMHHIQNLQWEEALTRLRNAEYLGYDPTEIQKLRDQIKAFITVQLVVDNGDIESALSFWTEAVLNGLCPPALLPFKKRIDAEWSKQIENLTVDIDNPEDIKSQRIQVRRYLYLVENPIPDAEIWSAILGYLQNNSDSEVPETLPCRAEILQILTDIQNDNVEEAYIAIGKLEEAKHYIAAGVLLRVADVRAEHLYGREGATKTRLAFLNLAQT